MEVTKRFKGLDLVDRMPEELWTEVCNIVQEAGTKTIPKKRNARRKNDNLKALKIPVERSEKKKKRSERQRRKGKIPN